MKLSNISSRLFFSLSLLLATTILSIAGVVTYFEKPKKIVLKTEHIPVLSPHVHGEGDSATDVGHHEHVESTVLTASEDLWITEMRFSMHNAPAETLHHAQLIDIDKTGWFCPEKGRILSVFGNDNMHEPRLAFPSGYAFFIPKGTRLKLSVAVHNPLPPIGSGGEYRDVSMSLTFTTAQPDGLRPLSYRLLYLDDQPCGEYSRRGTFTVPPHSNPFSYTGTEHPKTGSYVFSRRSDIVYALAHSHGWQGGRELTVHLNDAIVSRLATRSSDAYVFETFHGSVDVHVREGDALSIEAVYVNPHDVAVRGAMGMLGIYYAEE